MSTSRIRLRFLRLVEGAQEIGGAGRADGAVDLGDLHRGGEGRQREQQRGGKGKQAFHRFHFRSREGRR
ncbi:MAG: hypothetical protein M5R42_06405 [Rhodocyclaceae bacterium]|nr:hypothetical protein [Rhodocyclaceae bacterium]